LFLYSTTDFRWLGDVSAKRCAAVGGKKNAIVEEIKWLFESRGNMHWMMEYWSIESYGSEGFS